jgi:hypothetical protein
MQTEDKTPSAADGHVCSTDGLGPLPEPYLSAHASALILGPNVHESLFTSDQMRAYAAAEVAKERERCAKIADGFAMIAFGVAESSFKHCAAEIRSEKP